MWRVIATQETGEEITVKVGIREYEDALALADKTFAEYEEWRDCWVEKDPIFQEFRF